jgi:hypothetical protein
MATFPTRQKNLRLSSSPKGIPISYIQKSSEPEAIPASDPRRQVPKTEEGISESLVFFKILNQSLTEAGPRPGEEGLIGLFKRIGIGPGVTFDPDKLDAAMREGLTKAIEDGWKLVRARSATSRTKIVNAWAVATPDSPTGAWGLDTLQRAGLAHRGIYSNTSAEYAIIAATSDADGQPLTGDRKYVISMKKEDFPKVNAYWGVTIYKLPERLFFPNAVQRWMVNSLDKAVKYNADGSLDIQIQKDSPGKDKEANWLPTPEGPFQLVFRMYGPTDPKIFFGEYAPGPVRRVN